MAPQTGRGRPKWRRGENDGSPADKRSGGPGMGSTALADRVIQPGELDSCGRPILEKTPTLDTRLNDHKTVSSLAMTEHRDNQEKELQRKADNFV